ncbi:MAG: chromosome segregation protein SMC [Chthoniobacteraceae bacterium]
MYLQALEIFGFKSFAAKTVLNFHRGVTAVVGPNGCGKSNVLDAIRWVLGEQSAKALRGGEMSDVIFSGTDSRAALGMAEVSLTFAECEKELGVEYNEVCITRRVFRDGQSEYLLNKTPCRLRDIHQLFMDTGIGRSAYSIMEQGKIDLILSSKPEDRRAIFEEAAGITKFKSQKREALRKLEATDANLLRVTDIIKEVKRQIGSLQRQAGKARRYQTLIADLKTFDTHLSHRQFKTLDESLASTIAEIERLRLLQDNHEQEVETHESELSSQRHTLDEMEQQLMVARQVVQELKNHISNAENRIGFNRERINEFTSLADRYRQDISAAEEKLLIQETQIQNTDLELEQIISTLSFEQQRLEEKIAALSSVSASRVEAENALQGVFNSINKAENRIGSLRGEISNVIGVRDGSESRLGALQEEITLLAASLEDLARQHSDTLAQLEQSTVALSSQQENIVQADETLRSVKANLDQIDRELSVEQRTLAEKESKLEVLQQLNEEGEGFAAGTQTVLRGLDNPEFFKPSILGALASQIEVEPQYISAIEAALGQNLQAIIMKDSTVAGAVIKTLSLKKLGRASLALRDVGTRSLASGERQALPEGAVAWAVDQVKSSEETGPLVHTLLRDFVIVSDIETAIRLSQNASLSFVTLNGEVLTAEGILQGGQTGEAVSSVLHRKNQIAQLEGEVGAVRARIQQISTQRGEIADQLELAQVHLAESREEVQRITLSASTLRGQSAMQERELAEARRKAENLQWERGNIETRRTDAEEKLHALETELASSGSTLEDSQSRLSQLQGELEALRAHEMEAGGELNELRIKVATEKQRQNSLSNQRQPMTARLLELRELIEQRNRDIESYHGKSQNLAAESERIQGEIEAKRGEWAEGDVQVQALVEERMAVTASVESQESTLRIMRRQLNDCHEQRGQQEVKQTQIQLRVENLADHVMRRYQIDIREFQPDTYTLVCTLRDQGKRPKKGSDNGEAVETAEAGTPEETQNEEAAVNAAVTGESIDWALVESLVKDMDQRIDSMGPINLEAIQEYDELEQRHTFLEQQNNDLTSSKAELLDVISKINETTRKLFAETFEQVRVNFSEMFVELFGGGKANLVLTDESDPLESGIDIIAKPPGKQLQSISLLSGGEKTMTAVALLFSIYMVKPSPFCVLDEMDAPLDESNINRFIKILDRFVAQSQFVVITHNKRTIAKADLLYGVTMEEHGVSKLVGVKFSKREDSSQSSDIIGTGNAAAVPSVAESFGKSGDLHSERLQAG